MTLGLDQAPPADARLSHLVGSSRPGGRQRVRAAAPLPRDALESREGTLRGKEETLLEGAGAWGQKPPGTRRWTGTRSEGAKLRTQARQPRPRVTHHCPGLDAPAGNPATAKPSSSGTARAGGPEALRAEQGDGRRGAESPGKGHRLRAGASAGRGGRLGRHSWRIRFHEEGRSLRGRSCFFGCLF